MKRGKGTIDLRNMAGIGSQKGKPQNDQAPIVAPHETSLPVVGSEYIPAHIEHIETSVLPLVQSQTAAPVLPDSFEWIAFEHEQTDFGPFWYVVPGGIMAMLFALALFVQNYFFAAFVLIAFAALVLFHNQPPKKISFSIGKEGLRAGKTLYQFSRIKSFWIFERPAHPELSLETSQTLSPYIRLPLGNTNQEKVRELLLRTIPEQQHQQFLIDEIMRIIGF